MAEAFALLPLDAPVDCAITGMAADWANASAASPASHAGVEWLLGLRLVCEDIAFTVFFSNQIQESL